MNRIKILASSEARTDSGECTPFPENATAGNCAFPSCFIPLHFEPNYAYPLLIWLHGDGSNESELPLVMPYVSLRNYVAYAPRSPGSSGQQDGAHEHVTWPDSEESIVEASQRVFECLELARTRFQISPERVFIAGRDAGGTMALRLALANPECFKGACSIGGSFPEGHAPLAAINDARHLQLMIAHGRSSSYDEETVCHDLRLLHVAGLSVTLRQYPCGDEMTDNMLRDLDRWMMQHITGQDTVNANTWPKIESLN